jgi:hypothetical protein
MPHLAAVMLSVEPAHNPAAAPLATFPGLRVLCWQGPKLYASRGYQLFCGEVAGVQSGVLRWQEVGTYRAVLWRQGSVTSRWTGRLFRDGFHALAVLPSGTLVAAVPGAIIRLPNGGTEFVISHRITRGTRPLHIASTPDGRLFWGEYFDNAHRKEVHVYGSDDEGKSWDIVYSFAAGTIRHVHNVVYDAWEDCLWILTGDYGDECRIIRVSLDFQRIDTVVSGNQHARAVAMVPTKTGLYFSSDTPLERNHIFHLDRSGLLARLAELSSSSIYGCRVGEEIFFSTMVEPSRINPDKHVRIYSGGEHGNWKPLLTWKKDCLPMRYFQYGNAILPDGNNTGGVLALTTIAVEKDDLTTSLWGLSGTKSADE